MSWLGLKLSDQLLGFSVPACGDELSSDAMLFWIAGFKYAEASVAAILNQTSTIWIVVLAALFLHEPLTWKRGFGAFLAFAGVALIALGNG